MLVVSATDMLACYVPGTILNTFYESPHNSAFIIPGDEKTRAET